MFIAAVTPIWSSQNSRYLHPFLPYLGPEVLEPAGPEEPEPPGSEQPEPAGAEEPEPAANSAHSPELQRCMLGKVRRRERMQRAVKSERWWRTV